MMDTYVYEWTDSYGLEWSSPAWRAYLSIPAAKRAANRVAKEQRHDIVRMAIVTAYREVGAPVVVCRRERDANGNWKPWERTYPR